MSGVRSERGDGRDGSDDGRRRRDDTAVEDFEVEEKLEAIRQAGAVSENYAEQRFFGCLTGDSEEPLSKYTPYGRDEEKTFHHSGQNHVGT